MPKYGQYRNCTKDTCPVEASVYGYYPSLPANSFFVAIFALSFAVHLIQGIRWRSWSFVLFMGIGTFGETAGYVGRIIMHGDPFSSSGFKCQIIALTVAPAFLAAGIYLTLKHLVIILGPGFSRIRPKWYTWIFMGCDILSILIQAGGAGIAAAAVSSNNQDRAQTGNNTMIFGLAFQVFTMVSFGVMASEYAWRVRKFRQQLNVSTLTFRRSGYFKLVTLAITVAYFAILIRCIYRVAEMAGGWRNSIMRDEALFIALDSVMCALCVLVFNIFHPGKMFRQSKTADKAGHPSTNRQTEMESLQSDVQA